MQANNLQNPENKSEIICDEKLEKLTGEKVFRAFGYSKLIKHHILTPTGAASDSAAKPKQEVKQEVKREASDDDADFEVEVSDTDD